MWDFAILEQVDHPGHSWQSILTACQDVVPQEPLSHSRVVVSLKLNMQQHLLSSDKHQQESIDLLFPGLQLIWQFPNEKCFTEQPRDECLRVRPHQRPQTIIPRLVYAVIHTKALSTYLF